jgi:hypothetical protein
MPPLAISRRQIYLLWCLAWFLLIVLLIQPISYAIMRAAIDGEHILAYVGANRSIEADPGDLKVIAVTVPNLDNFWFQVPVYVLRWQQLALVSASEIGAIFK